MPATRVLSGPSRKASYTWEYPEIEEFLLERLDDIRDKTCRAVGVNADSKVFYETAASLAVSWLLRDRYRYRNLKEIHDVELKVMIDFVRRTLRKVLDYDNS